MKAIFLENDDVFLSPLSKEDDMQSYSEWLNNQETTLFMWSGKFPKTIEGLREYVDCLNNSKEGVLLGVFLKNSSEHIGNISLNRIDWKNRSAEIGLLIGNKKVRGKGYATQALGVVVDHAFQKLNLRRLYAVIVEKNESSKRIFEKKGFKLEGVYREHFYLDDKYYDCHYYGLLKKEYLNKENMK